jgi:ABC-type antimicrobial peptide transport system permease subunit
MIAHIIKLVWNQKKSYSGIFIEQALIACILMFCIVQFSKTVQKYTDPGVLDTYNTLIFDIGIPQTVEADIRENIKQNTKTIIENMKKLPYVEAITRSCRMAPYMYNPRLQDTVFIDGKKIQTELKGSDEYGMAVFRPVIKEGVWLQSKPLSDGTSPVVITQQFADKAGWNNSLGKKIQFNSRTYTVVGVIEGLKKNLFQPSSAILIIPTENLQENGIEYVARVKDKELFANAFYKECKRLVTEYKVDVSVTSVDMMKQAQVINNLIGLILMSVPTLFLSIFAFIGTFGLFWLHSKKHFREFALRIAIGATKKQLIWLVISESLIVTGFAIIPSLIISFFIYDYASIADLSGILLTLTIMLLFSIISAWYPAWKVSKVNPSEALQYE